MNREVTSEKVKQTMRGAKTAETALTERGGFAMWQAIM